MVWPRVILIGLLFLPTRETRSVGDDLIYYWVLKVGTSGKSKCGRRIWRRVVREGGTSEVRDLASFRSRCRFATNLLKERSVRGDWLGAISLV